MKKESENLMRAADFILAKTKANMTVNSCTYIPNCKAIRNPLIRIILIVTCGFGIDTGPFCI
jgi:hypothetical protein